MNFSGLAYINHNEIRVPDYLMRPLNIDHKTKLAGVYYPMPKEYLDFTDYKEINHDLIFSPIPFAKWPYISRLTLRLKEKLGILSEIAEFLCNQKINIITADCHLAGHRFIIWSTFIEFEDIRIRYEGKDTDIENRDEIKDLVFNKSKELSKLIQDNLKHVLFKSSTEGWTESVNVIRGRELEHHYWKVYKDRNNKIQLETDIFFRNQFETEVLSNTIKIPESIKNDQTDINKLLPSFGFASSITHAPILRTKIIKKNRTGLYKRVIVNYQRKSGTPSSRGLFSTISECFKNNRYNLHNVMNQTWVNSEDFESGRVEFIMQKIDSNDKAQIDTSELDDIPEEEIDTLKSKLVDSIQQKLNLFPDVVVRPINPYRIFISLDSTFFFRENLIDICYKIGEELGLSKDSFIIVDSQTDPSTEVVMQSIKKCDAMLQFYINFGKEKTNFGRWLDAEYLAAAELEKPIYRIDDGKTQSPIDRDKQTKRITPLDSIEKLKVDIKVGLKQLIDKMRKNREQILETY